MLDASSYIKMPNKMFVFFQKIPRDIDKRRERFRDNQIKVINMVSLIINVKTHSLHKLYACNKEGEAFKVEIL